MHSINVLIQDRGLIHRTVAGLSTTQLMHIPPGFDNNMAWNLGHILVVQQLLTYRLSGLPLQVTDEQVAMFRTGTSPADWAVEPDVMQLLPLLDASARQLAVDYEDGQFAGFQSYNTSTGIALQTIEEAIAFNNFHEGLHLGFILALKNLVASVEKKRETAAKGADIPGVAHLPNLEQPRRSTN